MANFKISDLPPASSVLTSDQFEVNQGGVSMRVTAAQILAGENYFTAQSVLFAGANGEISQDNTSFRYDSATKKMAIGNSAFATQLLTLGTPGGPAGSIYLAGSTSGAVVVDVSATASRLQINAGIAVNSELIYSTTSKGLSLIANPGSGASTGFTIQNTFNNAGSTALIQLLNANNSQDVRFQAFGQGSSDNAFVGTVSNTGFDIYTNGLKSLIISAAGEMVARAGLSLYTNKWVMSRTTSVNFVGQEDDGVGMIDISNYQGSNNTASTAYKLMYSDGNNYYSQQVYGSNYATVGVRNQAWFLHGTTTIINMVQSSAYTIQYAGTAKFALAATTGAATFHSGSVTTGVVGSQTGVVVFAGGTSGSITLTPAAAIGGSFTQTFQSATGTIALVASTVSTLTGTANQVLVNGTSGSATSGAITLTLPQSIATSSTPQFAGIGIGIAALSIGILINNETLAQWNTDATSNGRSWGLRNGYLASGDFVILSSSTNNNTLNTVQFQITRAGAISAPGSVTLGALSGIVGTINLLGTTSGTAVINTDATASTVTINKALSITGALDTTANNNGVIAGFRQNNTTLGYGVYIEAEGTDTSRYAFVVRNLAGTIEYFKIITETGLVGKIKMSSLAGTGTRNVVVDANGVLSAP